MNLKVNFLLSLLGLAKIAFSATCQNAYAQCGG